MTSSPVQFHSIIVSCTRSLQAYTHGITKKVMDKQLYADNTSNVIFDPDLPIARVLYPSPAMRPLVQHLRVEIPSIGIRTVHFLRNLARVCCQTFTGLKKLILIINGIGSTALDASFELTPTLRSLVVEAAITHLQGQLIHFPTPV